MLFQIYFGLFQIAKFWEEFHCGFNCFQFGVSSFCVAFLNFLLSLFDKSEMFGQFIRSQCNKQVSRRTKTLKFSSRFGKSIFIVIYFTRYTSREMERSDRLSRSTTKYVLHRSEVHRLFHFYTDQRDWYTWLEHLRAKAAADAHEIISFLYGSLPIYNDLSNL